MSNLMIYSPCPRKGDNTPICIISVTNLFPYNNNNNNKHINSFLN